MVDTDFEKDSRAHSFWQEWQKAADQPTEPETITEHLASVSEDWAVVLERFKRLIKEHKSTEEFPFKKHHPRTDVMINPCLWNPSKEPAPFKVLSVDSVPFDANRINDPDFDPFGFKETSP